MIDYLDIPTNGVDVWYADDASACAPLCDLKKWFSKLLCIGPSYGCYQEPKKCVLVKFFSTLGVKVTTSHRLLGGVIGDQDVNTAVHNYDTFRIMTKQLIDALRGIVPFLHRKGGLVTRQHNEVRDAFGDLASMAWSNVVKEPVVRDANCSTNTSALVVNLSVRGLWVPQSEALFDVRIVDTDARFYSTHPPIDAVSNADSEKKGKYQEACKERRALFIPISVSVDGMMGIKTSVFLKHLAERLALK
uniref:Uncharacterized protein n=1 Tax=Amphimedon queenslandica TaxID=400682 RepID=A0A1X7UI80_AMPQE